MTRTKVQLAYMQNDGARKATLKKRKAGLMKKVHELSTLCGVDACVIIYSPNSPDPDVWPSRLGAEHVISKFKNMPAFEKSRKMEDQDKFSKQEFAKADDQLKKLQKENRLKELSLILNNTDTYMSREWMQSQSYEYLIYLNNYVLKPQMDEMKRRIAMLKQEPSAST